MSALVPFVAHAEESPQLQQRLRDSAHAIHVIDLAVDCGYALSLEELRLASRDLCAPWLPWSGRGRDWRRAFFHCRCKI